MCAATRSKNCLRRRSILRDVLSSEAGSRVIRLVLVELLRESLARSSLRQSPAGEILLRRSVSGELGGVPAGSNRCGSSRVIFEATATTEAEGV